MTDPVEKKVELNAVYIKDKGVYSVTVPAYTSLYYIGEEQLPSGTVILAEDDVKNIVKRNVKTIPMVWVHPNNQGELSPHQYAELESKLREASENSLEDEFAYKKFKASYVPSYSDDNPYKECNTIQLVLDGTEIISEALIG